MKILILSDIHANNAALNKVLETEKDYDKLFFLGDVVDYGPNPVECLEFIRQNADYYVRGNHDNALGYGVECGSMGTFKEFSVQTRKWHTTILNDKQKDFLKQMPTEEHISIEGYSFFLTHASPKGNISEYLNEDEITEEMISHISENIILLGHTHVQFSKKVGDKLVVNPGSVGLARDGGEACYAVFTDGNFELKQLPYDAEKTIADLFAAPLPEHVKEGLKRVLLSS